MNGSLIESLRKVEKAQATVNHLAGYGDEGAIMVAYREYLAAVAEFDAELIRNVGVSAYRIERALA